MRVVGCRYGLMSGCSSTLKEMAVGLAADVGYTQVGSSSSSSIIVRVAKSHIGIPQSHSPSPAPQSALRHRSTHPPDWFPLLPPITSPSR
jgi:hypothetical protein